MQKNCLPLSMHSFLCLSGWTITCRKTLFEEGLQIPGGLHTTFPWRKCSVENSPCSCLSISLWGRGLLVLWQNVYEAPGTPLVFGHLWLSKYNLHIDRVQNTIAGLSLSCHQDSLLSALRLGASTSPDHRFEPLDLSSVPSACHGLANIFHKDLALYPSSQAICQGNRPSPWSSTTHQQTVQSVQAGTGGHGEVHHPQMPESLTW